MTIGRPTSARVGDTELAAQPSMTGHFMAEELPLETAGTLSRFFP